MYIHLGMKISYSLFMQIYHRPYLHYAFSKLMQNLKNTGPNFYCLILCKHAHTHTQIYIQDVPKKTALSTKQFWVNWQSCNFFAIWIRQLIYLLKDVDLQLFLELKTVFKISSSISSKSFFNGHFVYKYH